MIKQAKPIVMEKYEFDYREKLKVKLLLRDIFGSSGLQCQDQDPFGFQTTVLLN